MQTIRHLRHYYAPGACPESGHPHSYGLTRALPLQTPSVTDSGRRTRRRVVTDSDRRTRRRRKHGAGRHAPQLHELITVHMNGYPGSRDALQAGQLPTGGAGYGSVG